MALCFLGLNLILVLSGTGIVIVYGAVCLASIIGRSKGRSQGATYRMPLYPFWPVVGLIALAYVLDVSALDPELGQPACRQWRADRAGARLSPPGGAAKRGMGNDRAG